MRKVCVAIRVYSRVSDLECLVEVINKTWLRYQYDIYVISNGTEDGHPVPADIKDRVHKIICIQNNAGHQSGSSQLLLAFWDNVNLDTYDYTIIIEADTWVYGDKIICKYIGKMEKVVSVVYAAAKWYDRYYSLATDFAIIRNTFLKDNRDLFVFSDKAECHMANYVMDNGAKFMYIKENMLPHLPTYIKEYPYTQKGRIVCFPFSKMVTHHIELLEGGIKRKKILFNAVSNSRFFDSDVPKFTSFIERTKMTVSFIVTKLLIRRTWYSSTVRMVE